MTSEPFEIETSLDLLIALLFAPGQSGKPGEPIDGITRLQKLLFLLEQGEGPKAVVEAAQEFLFEAYKMGPFSKNLYDDLEILNSIGLLSTSKLEYVISDDGDPSGFATGSPGSKVVESIRYRLSKRGMEAGKELFENLKKKEREALVEFKSFFNSIPLRQLLIFVYQNYEDYTGESQIKGQLGI